MLPDRPATRPVSLRERLTDATTRLEAVPDISATATRLAHVAGGFFVVRLVSVLLDSYASPHHEAFALAEQWCTPVLEALDDLVGRSQIRRFFPEVSGDEEAMQAIATAAEFELFASSDEDIDRIGADMSPLAAHLEHGAGKNTPSLRGGADTYGTHSGIRAVASTTGHIERNLRYIGRRCHTRHTARDTAVSIANATFATRDPALWGEGSTAVASGSTHSWVWDRNLFTEWHSRYGGPGIFVYWHVERGSVVVYSQTLKASASEVAAMVEGAIRNGITSRVEGNYGDSDGQLEIKFAVTRLLNQALLPRIKQINTVRLYQPQPDASFWSHFPSALHCRIRWGLIADNYDQVIKFATVIRTVTPFFSEAIRSRFTRSASQGAYQAMLEIGRVRRTILVARYLRHRDLQAALVYLNALMLQDGLADETWTGQLTAADRRGLTPLFCHHIRPYGDVRFDLGNRLNIGPLTAAALR